MSAHHANHHVEEHDLGLRHDLVVLERLNRRRALGLLGIGAGAFALAGCGGDDTGSTGSSGSVTATPTPTPSATATPTPSATTGASGTCTAFAAETNGPYPADGTNTARGSISNVLTLSSFQRADIRSTAGTGAMATGVPTTVTLTVVDVNSACTPLAGYAVYLWHCDPLGLYSLYDQPNESWLRGVQVTDANGQVTFTTVFPGCYAGRFPHIHFEIFSSLANATSGRYARLVSQLAMPVEACNAVYADTAVYGASKTRFATSTIATDNVFGDNSAAQKTAMTLVASGSPTTSYTSSATVGLTT
jgi:protocatechuate 3,4-dioxygenase beta subunit